MSTAKRLQYTREIVTISLQRYSRGMLAKTHTNPRRTTPKALFEPLKLSSNCIANLELLTGKGVIWERQPICLTHNLIIHGDTYLLVSRMGYRQLDDTGIERAQSQRFQGKLRPCEPEVG